MPAVFPTVSSCELINATTIGPTIPKQNIGGSSSRTQVMQMPTMSPIPFVRAMAIEAVSGNARTSNAEMPRMMNEHGFGRPFFRKPASGVVAERQTQNSNGEHSGPDIERAAIERRHQLGSHQFHCHQRPAFDKKDKKEMREFF